jgi:glycosyltransferase involved in cell wall biosynthesis
MARPRVLSVHASAAVGGSGKSWILLLRALRAGCEVWTSPPAPFPSPELDRSRELPLNCPQISRRVLGNLRYVLTFPYYVWRYARMIREHGIGVVHVNSFYLLQPMAAAKLSGCRLVTHVREAKAKYPAPLYEFWRCCAEALSDRLVFCAQSDMPAFKRNDGIYLPNWISLTDVERDLTDAAETDRLLTAAGSGPALLVVSQLIRGKGHEFALDLFAELRKIVPEVRLLLAGGTSGNANNERHAAMLRERAAALGPGAVTFLGEVKNICAAMRRCGFVLMPSPAESFSRVHLEAMASGAVLIATDAGSTGVLVEDMKDGVVVRYGEPKEAAEKVARVLRDPALAKSLAESGRKKIEASYTDRALAGKAAEVIS